MLAGALLAAAVGGCAGEPGENATAVTYHITPLPRNYKDLVTEYLKTRGKDRPITKVGDAYQDSCRVGADGRYYGWAVPVSYRAKRGPRAPASQEIIWVNHNSVQMISNDGTSDCFKA
jgi:hypothetical protein